MLDERNMISNPGTKRIQIHDPYEIELVARRNGVTQKEVVDAVKVVGTSAEAVDRYLREHSKT